MDKELKDKLEANGFDVDVTLQRFMNNEKLYFKFLKKLPADQDRKSTRLNSSHIQDSRNQY